MTESILDSIKGTLGIAPDYSPFDQELTLHINSVFADLALLGVGPADGFMIHDNGPKWIDYLPEESPLTNNVKSYMSLRIQLLFDGPSARYTIEAIQSQITKFEFMINVNRESTEWVDPNPSIPTPVPPSPLPEDEKVILDGGVL